MNEFLNTGTIAAMIRIASPLLLVALGVAICIKAGIFNIAVEGFMLMAAFSCVVLTSVTGSVFWGIVISTLIIVGLSMLFGVIIINLKADQIIAGLGMNMLALGITSWFLQSVLLTPGQFMDSNAPKLPTIELGFLNAFPTLHEIFSGIDVITYIAWILALIIYLFVHQSKFGLRLRATGEHPIAATTVGISIVRWQFIALILTGILCTLAGASLALAHLGLFTKAMTAGRGFIAFAAASFATGNIFGTIIITYVFALCGSIAIRLEGLEVDTHLIQMIPYLATLIALILARKRNQNL
jgi:ABC-type uncharacterized transport system permease subunit